MESPADKNNFPTEFRGCLFEAEWHCKIPCVIYYPRAFQRLGFGSNSRGVDRLIEEICLDLIAGEPIHDGGLKEECEWRGWSIRGFSRRKNAVHIQYILQWYPVDREVGDDGEWDYEIIKRQETQGPLLRGHTGISGKGSVALDPTAGSTGN